MYLVYLDKILLPITPSKIQIKVGNQNKTYNLINDGECNLIKSAGLREISFDALLPNQIYPFATYNDGFIAIDEYLTALEKLKQVPFMFKIIRKDIQNNNLHNTNLKVSIESYTIKEDFSYGLDTLVSISLKEFKECVTKTYTEVETESEETTISVTENRTADVTQIVIGSTVVLNGTLHRDSYGNVSGQTKTNYTGKVNFINTKGSHPYHVTTPNGGWLGWVLESAVVGV